MLFACLAEAQTLSFIVEVEQSAASPSQNFSIKPELDTLSAIQTIDMKPLQDKPAEFTSTYGYSGPDTPPDDKPRRPGGLRERLTTIFESVSWQLLYASNGVVGYRLFLLPQKDSLSRQPFSWVPVVAMVVVGWLSGSYWNPEAPMFNQLDEQASNQKHELQIITFMNPAGSGYHYQISGSSVYGPSFNIHSGGAGTSHHSFVNEHNGNDSGWPTFSGHTHGENCYEQPCCHLQGHCIYAPSAELHPIYCPCDVCKMAFDQYLAPIESIRCNPTSDHSFVCGTNFYPQTGGQEPTWYWETPTQGSTIISQADSTTDELRLPPAKKAKPNPIGHQHPHTGQRFKKKNHVCGRTNKYGQPCGKAFSRGYDLRRHIAGVHDQKKDYVCDRTVENGQLCGKAFSQTGNLRKHIQNVHEK